MWIELSGHGLIHHVSKYMYSLLQSLFYDVVRELP
jgi:hypothetical protein